MSATGRDGAGNESAGVPAAARGAGPSAALPAGGAGARVQAAPASSSASARGRSAAAGARLRRGIGGIDCTCGAGRCGRPGGPRTRSIPARRGPGAGAAPFPIPRRRVTLPGGAPCRRRAARPPPRSVRMTQLALLPLWLFLILAALAAWAVLERMLVPSARWFVRQRTNRVIEEINTRLPFELPPFTLTRRQVLIDRLVYDPRVMEAVDAHAREHGMPREVVVARVERYAREIVPAFNAYLYFRVGYWAGRRVARMLYRVRLGYADEDGLAGIERGSTVVF